MKTKKSIKAAAKQVYSRSEVLPSADIIVQVPNKNGKCITTTQRYSVVNDCLIWDLIFSRFTLNTDVIMGRGTTICHIPGNVNFRRVCWKFKQQYLTANRHDKQSIALQVLDEISCLDPPGRVLEIVDGGKYVIAEHERAVEKACQQLREKKAKKPEGMSDVKRSSPNRPASRRLPVQQDDKVRRSDSVKRKTSKREQNDDDLDNKEAKPMIVKSKAAKKVIKKKKALKNRKLPPTKENPKKASKTMLKPSLIHRRSLRLAISKSIQEHRHTPANDTDTREETVDCTTDTSEVMTPVTKPPASTKKTLSTKKALDLINDSPIPKKKSPIKGILPVTSDISSSTITDTEIPPAPPEAVLALPPLTFKTSTCSMPDFLRGYSNMSFRPGSIAYTALQQYDSSAFETGLAGITEPPPLAAFSSGFSFSSMSALKVDATNNTARASSRGNLVGDETVAAPVAKVTTLQPFNSLFIEDMPTHNGSVNPDVFLK